MKLLGAAVSMLGLLAPTASALKPRLRPGPPGLPPLRAEEMVDPSELRQHQQRIVGPLHFQQLIDHANPSLGTFSQRYWWNDQFYAGPGSPVVFLNAGEDGADGFTVYLTNKTITGLIAQEIGAAIILFEHRYFGQSSPYTVLSTANMTHLTLANSIADQTYFARNVKLAFDVDGSSRPDRAPWVASGSSYSGALSAWTATKDPGTFWAYHASSAVVEAIADYSQYYAPVLQGMPKNCSADVVRVIDYIDSVLETGSDSDKLALKTRFGLQGVEHDDDFATVLTYGPNYWQVAHYGGDAGRQFFQWCDYVENMWPGSTAALPGAEGVGLEKALAGYAKWVKELWVPNNCAEEGYSDFNGTYNVECFNSHNASSPYYTDLSLDNAVERQWYWLLCNEPFEWWVVSPPDGMPRLVSRFITLAYYTRKCSFLFSPGDGTNATAPYGIAAGKTAADVNAYTGGWFNVNTTRLVWTNSQFDMWRDATVSADTRPGGPLVSTPEAPVNVIPGGNHGNDMLTRWGQENPAVKAVQDAEIAVISQWVDEFYTEKNITRGRGSRH